jgi:hypothetical protein
MSSTSEGPNREAEGAIHTAGAAETRACAHATGEAGAAQGTEEACAQAEGVAAWAARGTRGGQEGGVGPSSAGMASPTADGTHTLRKPAGPPVSGGLQSLTRGGVVTLHQLGTAELACDTCKVAAMPAHRQGPGHVPGQRRTKTQRMPRQALSTAAPQQEGCPEQDL